MSLLRSRGGVGRSQGAKMSLILLEKSHVCVLQQVQAFLISFLQSMVCGPVQAAKRALVSVICALAAVYGVGVACRRDSPDDVVLKDFRRLALKTHPDRGGQVGHQQQLNDARLAWEAAKKPRTPASAPAQSSIVPAASPSSGNRKEFRINATAILLTYQAMTGYEQWIRFNDFVRGGMKGWKVKHWCSTLETASHDASTFHIHLMLQFCSTVDKTAAAFCFESVKPNVQPTDLCGEGLSRKKLQSSIDRGFFYVWADKVGTARAPDGEICVAGNYFPCWVEAKFRYQVLGAWPEKLWKQRKLTHQVYREYLFQTRDGVVGRKRNFDAVVAEEERLEIASEIEATAVRIKSNPALYKPFPEIPEVTAWQRLFAEDALRYPVLILQGPSMCGKTEFANSLFQKPLELKIGPLLHFPDKLRSFDRKLHDGIVLDDVRDLQFLAENQDKIQGKYNVELEFGITPGGQCKYEKYLFRVPIVATINDSTLNLQYLQSHDWLGKAGNRVLVQFPGLPEASSSSQ